jgi:exodeoxyribonuclease VII large subunit
MTYDPETAPAPSANVPEYTVSQISGALKRTVEESYAYVRVRGEISRPSSPSSGHLYLTLKDDQATLQAVCWRGTVSKLGLRPEEGMEVICTGRLTTYPGRSSYQMIIERMELAGQGALLKMLEDRRKRLAAEGLFDAARKKPIPFLPQVIGVITSPTGAVIRDILHRLADRFPRPVLLWPVAVQGDGAAAQIANAIDSFNAHTPTPGVPRPDVLIVARGGGSIEDLWAFNEEVVVRAAAASAIPLISAVGHETDTTLIDFASDLRAPTPTAAAEMAVPVRRELLGQLLDLSGRMLAGGNRLLDERRVRVEGLARGLGDPRRLLETAMQRLDDRSERLDQAPRRWIGEKRVRLDAVASRLSDRPIRRALELGDRRVAELGTMLARVAQQRPVRAAERLEALARRLESVSYRRVLERGYAVVRASDGTPLSGVQAVAPGQALSLEFHDGVVAAHAEGEGGKPRKRGKADPVQPRLL